MPYLHVNDAALYYEEHGVGPQALVFAHGLLCSGRLFAAQVQAFKTHYRCITFDFRGQGQSSITRSGYDMDTLSRDAATLINALGATPCHFIGLSMGGFVGLRVAIHSPQLLQSLSLLGTSAAAELPVQQWRYRLLAWLARGCGIRAVVNRVMPIMFGQSFLRDPSHAALVAEWKQRISAGDRVGLYRAALGVISRPSVADQLERIAVPTLIMVGQEDETTRPVESEQLQARIAGSHVVVLPRTGHLCTVEAPEAVNTTLAAFLNGLQ